MLRHTVAKLGLIIVSVLVAAGLVVGLAIAFCPADWTVSRQPVGTLTEAETASLVCADDGKTFAYVKGGTQVVQGGTPSPAAPSLTAAPPKKGGQTAAPANGGAQVSAGFSATGVQDFSVGASRAPSAIEGMTYAPHTGKLYYWTMDSAEGKERIVLVADGKVVPTPYDHTGHLRFSPDGAHWATVGYVGAAGAKSVAVLKDGAEVGRYKDASDPVFSDDGQHLAFLMDDGQSEGTHLVLDGEIHEAFPPAKSEHMIPLYTADANMPMWYRCQFLADGTLLMLTQDANGWTVYHGDKPISSHANSVVGGGSMEIISFECVKGQPYIAAFTMVTAKKAPVFAWWESTSGQKGWRVVRDGKPVDEILWPAVSGSAPSLSPDGSECAYIGVQTEGSGGSKGECYVAREGLKSGPYGLVWGLEWSGDGKHLAWAASDPKGKAWRCYLDGKPVGDEFDDASSRPAISRDGTHVAWLAHRGKQISLVIDGTETGSYDQVAWSPVFNDDGKVACFLREGGTVYRVDATPPAKWRVTLQGLRRRLRGTPQSPARPAAS